MERKIKVGAVSYLNTKPLIYGFENALIAEKLINDDLDIALVPVAVLPKLKEYYIIFDK